MFRCYVSYSIIQLIYNYLTQQILLQTNTVKNLLIAKQCTSSLKLVLQFQASYDWGTILAPWLSDEDCQKQYKKKTSLLNFLNWLMFQFNKSRLNVGNIDCYSIYSLSRMLQELIARNKFTQHRSTRSN